jgi:hypothetical protein
VREGALKRGGPRPRKRSPRARRTPPEGAFSPRAGRTRPEGVFSPRAGWTQPEGACNPRARRTTLEGAFRCAALAGRGATRGVIVSCTCFRFVS